MVGDVLKLHEYQEAAADEFYGAEDGVCCVADMGAGKTLTTLEALECLFRDGLIDYAIIFGPKRVAQLTWPQEAEKWGYEGVLSLAGKTPAQRVKALSEPHRILAVNYEIAGWLLKQGVRATSRTVIVMDEVSRMGEATGRQRKDVAKIAEATSLRWGLTGTPKGRDTLKMWGIVDILQPGVWGRSFRRWRARYHTPIDDDGHQWKVLAGCEELIDEDFAKMSFHVEAPKYSEAQLLFDPILLEPAARRAYDEMEREMVIELDGQDIMAEQSASQRMKLRQIAAGFVYDEDRVAHRIHDAKTDALWEIAQDSGDTLLALYQFLPEVEAVRKRWGYKVPILGGETTDKQAKEYLAAWDRGDLPILLAHEASMGHGLNMQKGGRRLVWMSMGDSYEQYLQTNARLARQGQERQVYAHHLVVGGSLEEGMCRAHVRKEGAEERLKALIRKVR